MTVGAIYSEYFDNKTLSGTPRLTANDEQQIAVNVPLGTPAMPGFGNDTSARWTTTLTASAAGTYTLQVTDGAYDAVRIWVGTTQVHNDWPAAAAAAVAEVPVTLAAGVATPFKVEFADTSGEAKLSIAIKAPGATTAVPLLSPAPLPSAAPLPAVGTITGEFFNNKTLTGTPKITSTTLTRISVNVPAGVAAQPGFGPDTSARWTTTLTAQAAGTYDLQIEDAVYDGVRIWVGDQQVYSDWPAASAAATNHVSVTLAAGVATPLKVEFADTSGAAKLSLTVRTPGGDTFLPLPPPAG